jgi:hypothetical protein
MCSPSSSLVSLALREWFYYIRTFCTVNFVGVYNDLDFVSSQVGRNGKICTLYAAAQKGLSTAVSAIQYSRLSKLK